MLSSARIQRGLLGVLVGLLAAIAVVLVIGRGSGAGAQVTRGHTEFDGATMPAHLRAADFVLSNQNGRRVSLARDRGHVVVLTFIHSLCKDDCPFMVEQIKGALNLLPGDGRNVRAIGVTVYPRQDTRANRRTFLAEHQMTNRMQFLNGPKPTLRRIWHAYGIAPQTPRTEHSAFVLLIDKRGYERVGFAAVQLTSPALAHDIRVLEKEPA